MSVRGTAGIQCPVREQMNLCGHSNEYILIVLFRKKDHRREICHFRIVSSLLERKLFEVGKDH